MRDWNGVLTAYDAGTAVIPEYRKQGITSRLFESLLVMLRAKQTAQYLLEVLQSNTPAFQLYRKKGFEDHAEFCLLSRRPGYRFSSEPRGPWRTRMASARRNGNAWRCWAITGPRGRIPQLPCELCPPTFITRSRAGPARSWGTASSIPKPATCRSSRCAATTERKGVAASILANLIQRTKSPRISLVNVDSESKTMIAFLNALGFERFVDQYEMLLEL